MDSEPSAYYPKIEMQAEGTFIMTEYLLHKQIDGQVALQAVDQKVLAGQRYESLTTFHSQKYGNETEVFLFIFVSAITGILTFD